jgi:hypothetical protein
MTRKDGGIFVGLLVFAFLLNSWGLAKWQSPGGRYWIWLATTGLAIVVVMSIGSALTGHPTGVIINNRNMMSLSKLQMLIWTLVVFPALVTAAAANLVGIGDELASTGPLDINIPNELLAALGLAGASLVGSPVILNTKASSEAHPDELPSTTAQLGLQPSQVNANGKVFAKTSRDDAQWADLFRGDEVGNADTVDLGKVQQFFVTLLLAGIYLGSIAKIFDEDGAIQALPPLSEKFVWLLAVSHGTYLASKAAPHTKDPKSS